MTEGKIPTVGEYRGVPLHCDQSEARLDVVRKDIDAAHALQDLDQLVPYASDCRNAPEARLLARAKAFSILDERTERREPRPRAPVWSRERIQASGAGLDLLQCRSRTHYCSRFDPGSRPGVNGPAPREVPLPERYPRLSNDNEGMTR